VLKKTFVEFFFSKGKGLDVVIFFLVLLANFIKQKMLIAVSARFMQAMR
jgi:hypothetical protein